MNKEQDYWDNIPLVIEPNIEMNEPNGRITFYKGEIVIKNNTDEILVNGLVYFQWFPHLGVCFTGLTEQQHKSLLSSNSFSEIFIDKQKLGEGFISSVKGKAITGVLRNEAVTGDRSINCEKIFFSVTNLREFFGAPVKKIEGESIESMAGRLVFETDRYTICLDKSFSYRNSSDQLKEKGGYAIQYGGMITNRSGSIAFDEWKKIEGPFRVFLSFLNGRRTSLLFSQGISGEEKIWQDFSPYRVDIYKSVYSWPQRHSIKGLNDLWKRFYELWQVDNNRHFLVSVIHWYVEANGNSGYAEGSIIMAQTGLELLYNWLIVEQKKILIGANATNIEAANKIRLLLSQLNIGYEIPAVFTCLMSYVPPQSLKNYDAPQIIVEIRNALVHSNEAKRKTLNVLDVQTKHEANQLSIWYLEMGILNILQYNGMYFNRCSSADSFPEAEELVPWAQKSTA